MRLLFERYRFAEEYHYQTVMKNDSDRFIDKGKHVCQSFKIDQMIPVY